MDFVADFFSLSTLVFMMVVFSAVFIQRKLVEAILPSLKEKDSRWNKLWTDFFVPVGPIATGGIIGWLVDNYPYPTMFAGPTAQIFYGIVCGLFSGLAYRLVKKNILEKLSSKVDSV